MRPSSPNKYTMKKIAIFGGTFDPPHVGHLKIAQTVQDTFSFERFLFLPCKSPVLKAETQTSAKHRLQMLKLMLKPFQEFTIDTREIYRDTPSYMVYTLESFHKDFGEQTTFTLMLGFDAFVQLPQWYQWEKILKQCNLLVINRPSSFIKDMPTILRSIYQQQPQLSCAELLQKPYGKIVFFDAGDYPISSTLIRQQLAQHAPIEQYLDKNVYHYIRKHHLYHT